MSICLCVTIASVLGFYEKCDGRPRDNIRAIKIKTRVCCFCFYTAIVIYSLCWQSQRLFILISFFLLVFDLAVTSEVKVKTEGDTMALYSRESCSTAGCAPALALCWTTTRRHTGLIRPWLYQSLLHTYSYTELILTIFSYIISSLYLVFLFFLSALFFFFFLLRVCSWSLLVFLAVVSARLFLFFFVSSLLPHALDGHICTPFVSSSVRWFIRTLTFLFNC